jgi:hypothetical protein
VGHHLGVGVGGKLVPRRLKLSLELREIFDDAVVDDEDLAVAVGVRVGVDERRLGVWPMPSLPVGMLASSFSIRVSTLASDLVTLVCVAWPAFGSSSTATPAES